MVLAKKEDAEIDVVRLSNFGISRIGALDAHPFSSNMSTEIIEISEREKIFNEHKEKIISAHKGFAGAAKSIGNSLLAAANYRREVGIYLESLKTATDSQGRKVVPHGEWEGLFATAKGKSNGSFTFDFDYNTARNYINFAKKHPEPITDVRQIMREGKAMLVDAGEVELTMPNFKPQHIESAYSLANKLWQGFNQKFINGILKKEDVTKWDPEYREDIKGCLKPIVDFYESL